LFFPSEMQNETMKSPVTLILFNRPDLTEKVFDRISHAKPSKLFLIADGPRKDNREDEGKCLKSRKVVENVSWDCEVYRNYSDENLGCGIRPATGISWVFEHVDSSIILEDDCLPHPSFFIFCDELLEKYKDDQRVMQVSGTNNQAGNKWTDYSYYFSKYNICAGGWATWKRAWDKYDYNMKLWPAVKNDNWLEYYVGDKSGAKIYYNIFEKAYNTLSDGDFWDYQWIFSFWINNGLSIHSSGNLLSNLGFRHDGTHTKYSKNKWANLPTENIIFPLKHPPYMFPNYSADSFILQDIINAYTVRPNGYGYIKGLKKKIAHYLKR
jgi:hypothetical protein